MTTATDAQSLSPAVMDTLRAELLAAVPPLGGHPEYAITDPAFIDPFLARSLAYHTKGLAPRDERQRADVVRSAAAYLLQGLGEADGLARVTKLVERRYQEPVITRQGDTVTIDAGIVAGRVAMATRGGAFIAESPYVEAHEWKTQEVARFLQLGMQRHPDAQTYRAEVELSARRGFARWSYVYDRKDDRVRVFVPERRDRVFVSEPLGGDLGPYLDGRKSLSYWQLPQVSQTW